MDLGKNGPNRAKNKGECRMFKHFLLVLVVAGLVLAQGCATTTGPATVINPATGQVVDVPSGNRVIVVTPGDPTLRSGASSDVYRHVETMAEINQRAQSDAYRHDEAIHRDDNNTAARVLDTLSRGAQSRQRERTSRSQNLQRTMSDAYRTYVNSGGQNNVPRQSAPRAIRAPQIRPIRQR